MDAQDISTFEQQTVAIRAHVDRIIELADVMRDEIGLALATLTQTHRTVAKLRRTEMREMMGPLNSLGAANQRHQSLGGNLHALEQHLATFEETARELRILQPEVVQAVREKHAASLAAAATLASAATQDGGTSGDAPPSA